MKDGIVAGTERETIQIGVEERDVASLPVHGDFDAIIR